MASGDRAVTCTGLDDRRSRRVRYSVQCRVVRLLRNELTQRVSFHRGVSGTVSDTLRSAIARSNLRHVFRSARCSFSSIKCVWRQTETSLGVNHTALIYQIVCEGNNWQEKEKSEEKENDDIDSPLLNKLLSSLMQKNRLREHLRVRRQQATETSIKNHTCDISSSQAHPQTDLLPISKAVNFVTRFEGE